MVGLSQAHRARDISAKAILKEPKGEAMKKDRKQEGKHDWAGKFDPASSVWKFATIIGFSVGIFQWVAKSSRKGLKKSAVIHRVKGHIDCPERVYKRAEELCDEMDKGKFPKTKSSGV